jgi:protein tyrosine kinase modulator
MHETVVEVLSELRSAWRFRWYGAAAAWCVALGGWTVVALMPDVYEASTDVYVDTSSLLKPLLKENVIPTDIDARLEYVRRALLGREYLDKVALENGLYVAAAAVTPDERDRVLERLGKNIQLDATSPAGRSNRADSGITIDISYRSEVRDRAVGVVTTLQNFLIEDTLSADRESADTTRRFLDDRIREYENRLQQAEQALANFQRENSGKLPGSEGSYFERMQRERDTLDETRRKVRLLESRREQLEKQLAGEAPVTAGEDTATRQPPRDSIDARIREARSTLDKLLLEYTDQHPDVIAQRQTLARLEQQRASQLKELGVNNPDQEVSVLSANPVYQALQIELNKTKVDMAELQAEAADRQRRLTELQGLISDIPAVEAELQRLNRDYDDLRKQYQVLVQSRETQMLSRKADEADHPDFRVINDPRAGFQPVAPRRRVLIAGVSVAALLAGGVLSYLLAQLKPVFSDVKTLSHVLGLPVLGVVSRALVSADLRRQRFALLSFLGAVTALVAMTGVLLGIEVFGPGLRGLLLGV